MKRKVHTWSVSTTRAPAEAFAYLADVTRHSEWSPKPYRVEDLSGPVEKGATFTSYGWIPGDGDHRNDVEVTEVDPPRRFALRSIEKGQTFENTFVVEPEGSGSRISRTIDLPVPGGVVGALFPVLFAVVVKPAVQKGMNLLGSRLDAGA